MSDAKDRWVRVKEEGELREGMPLLLGDATEAFPVRAGTNKERPFVRLAGAIREGRLFRLADDSDSTTTGRAR